MFTLYESLFCATLSYAWCVFDRFIEREPPTQVGPADR